MVLLPYEINSYSNQKVQMSQLKRKRIEIRFLSFRTFSHASWESGKAAHADHKSSAFTGQSFSHRSHWSRHTAWQWKKRGWCAVTLSTETIRRLTAGFSFVNKKALPVCFLSPAVSLLLCGFMVCRKTTFLPFSKDLLILYVK